MPQKYTKGCITSTLDIIFSYLFMDIIILKLRHELYYNGFINLYIFVIIKFILYFVTNNQQIKTYQFRYIIELKY